MIKKIKKLFNKYFDYDIVGEYYEYVGHNVRVKRYIKKYKIRKWIA